MSMVTCERIITFILKLIYYFRLSYKFSIKIANHFVCMHCVLNDETLHLNTCQEYTIDLCHIQNSKMTLF